MSISEKLQEMRKFYKELPMGLDLISEELGLSKATLSRFINGKSVSLENFEKLAVFYDKADEAIENLLLELLGGHNNG